MLEEWIKIILDIPYRLRKLRVEAIIFVGGMKLDNPQKLRKLRVEALIFTPTFMITSE